jgi:hypothetical protein
MSGTLSSYVCVSNNLKLMGIFMSTDDPTCVHFPTLLVDMQDGEGKILEHKILRCRQKNPCSYYTIVMIWCDSISNIRVSAETGTLLCWFQAPSTRPCPCMTFTTAKSWRLQRRDTCQQDSLSSVNSRFATR